MKKHLFPTLFLLILIIAIACLNTPRGVFLTGWDNLHPEFNLPLNIFRDIFSVWQEYEGVGSLSGMGHSANLIYQLILFPFSFLLPMNILRFLWNYLMLFLGPLGMYLLLYYIFSAGRKGVTREEGIPGARTEQSEEALTGGTPLLRSQYPWGATSGRTPREQNIFFESDLFLSLLGALFYVFNLATLQAFYTPLEVFTIHYASLPWIFLTTIMYFYNPSRKNLFFFALVLLFSVGQGYVPTVFFVSLLSFFVLASVFFLYNRTRHNLLSFGKMLLVIFCVNAFWLLPFLYFTKTESFIPVEAKINQMSTNNIFLQNKEFGKLTDVIMLKGFWFNNLDPSNTTNQLIMLPWRNYINHWYMWLLGFIFFAIVLVGVFQSVKKRTPLTLPFLVLFLISITALITATPPFSWINDLFRTHLPILNQAYRFPFTKFSLLAACVYAIFFAIGIQQLIRTVKNRIIEVVIYTIIGILLIVYMFPIFQGHLFYEKETIAIPKEYFSLFAYFQKQNPNTRIANLPQSTFWSWEFYTWGYQGSGFLWYGLPQALMDRAFDPWSNYNENYYWELSQALFSQNAENFREVLNKYQISYLIVDKNQYNPANALLFINPNIEDFLSHIPNMKKEQTFGNILVYHVQSNQPNNFIFLAPPLTRVNSSQWNNIDTFYNAFGNYVTDNQNPDIWYPFPALFSEHPEKLTINQTNNSIIFQTTVPSNAKHVLHVPTLSLSEIAQQFAITLSPPLNINGFDLATKSANVQIQPGNDSLFRVEIQKITDPFLSLSITPKKDAFTIQNCDTIRNGSMQVTENPKGITVSSRNATACLSRLLSYLPHNLGYVLFVTATHAEGQTLHIWISNPKENFLPLDTYLPSSISEQTYAFILPPMENFTTSYLLQIENASLADITTTNSIEHISAYPIPYDFLKNLTIADSLASKNFQTTAVTSVSHPNPSVYRIIIDPQLLTSFPTLVLSQSYNPGWRAYQANNWLSEALPFFFGSELKQHVKVNNWENGWILSNNGTVEPFNNKAIILIYLPQYLEYAGFLLLFFLFAYFLIASLVTNW